MPVRDSQLWHNREGTNETEKILVCFHHDLKVLLLSSVTVKRHKMEILICIWLFKKKKPCQGHQFCSHCLWWLLGIIMAFSWVIFQIMIFTAFQRIFLYWLRCWEGSCRQLPFRDLTGEFKLNFNIQFSQCKERTVYYCDLWSPENWILFTVIFYCLIYLKSVREMY